MRRVFRNFRWWENGETQSMVVEEGRVVHRGPHESSPSDGDVDLHGQWLMPGFVDGHCHILPTGLMLAMLDLDGAESPGDVMQALSERDKALGPGDWLLAINYDQNRFRDAAHLHRRALDQISTTRPILLRHVSGHASVANTAALELAGIGPETKNPNDGEFVRDEDGELSGLLLESAHETVSSSAPRPTEAEMVEAILAAGRSMSSYGITSAADMMTGRYDLRTELRAYTEAARRGCPIRLRLYLQWSNVLGRFAMGETELADLESGMDAPTCRIAGIKLFQDGAIGSRTAAIYGSYAQLHPQTADASGPRPPAMRLTSRRGSHSNGMLIAGQSIYPPDELKRRVRLAHETGRQIAIHAIGDYAVDVVFAAYEALDDPKRHRIEHAMMMNNEQVAKMASLGIRCTMQPEFLARFGSTYLRQLGSERAASIKRFAAVREAGVRLSFSSDRPIVSGRPWAGILAASSRPRGFDPEESMPMKDGVRAYSQMSADACEDAQDFGELNPGQWADFQVYHVEPGVADVNPSQVFLAGREI